MTPELLASLRDLGIVGTLVAALWTLHKRWWQPGWVVKELLAAKDKRISDLEADRDYWRSSAIRGLDAVERSATVVDTVVGQAEQAATRRGSR